MLSLVGAVLALAIRREGHVQAAFALAVVGLLGGSLLLPQGPFNLIARLAAGSTDATTWATILGAAATALALVPVAAWLVRRRIGQAD